MSRILIVDDEPSICWAFREFLTDEGHQVDVAASAEEGLKQAEQGAIDAVVLDIRLPVMDGLTALPKFRERVGKAPIVMITAFGDLETTVKAMEGGAFDYLTKPFDLDQASAVLKRALKQSQTRGATAPDSPARNDFSESMVGSSPAMQALFKRIALVTPTDVPVLLTGESGTGKEMVARAIHRYSGRRGGPFIPVCLAALSPNLIERELFGHIKGSFTGADQDRKGLLELANGGTVLLDEIGDSPLPLQVKLLRAIERGEVYPVGDARPRPTDFRVIAATNRPLVELMATGQFREDLFFRLSVFPIHLPPLRERREDILPLAEHFLRRAPKTGDQERTFSAEVLAVLNDWPWAGNVRELRNAIEHAAIVSRGEPIRPEHLPALITAGKPAVIPITQEIRDNLALWTLNEMDLGTDLPGQQSIYDRYLELTEPPVLESVLKRSGNNRAAAAQVLGIHRATLRQKLRKYGLE